MLLCPVQGLPPGCELALKTRQLTCTSLIPTVYCFTHHVIEVSVIQLLRLDKDNVCLWEVHHHLDKYRNARPAAVINKLDCLKKQVLDVKISDMSNKQHTALSQHQRELRLMKNSTKYGAGAGEIYV